MTYRDVTFSPDEVVWDRWPDREDLKDAIFDDHLFALFVIEQGVEGALDKVTQFHREIANQLIVRAVDVYQRAGWVGRTMRLCRAVKRRRNELRGLLRAEVGWAAAARVIEDVRLRYPRAVWGSEVES